MNVKALSMGYQGTTEPEQVQRLFVASGNVVKQEVIPKRFTSNAERRLARRVLIVLKRYKHVWWIE
jgi:hypothetical protein